MQTPRPPKSRAAGSARIAAIVALAATASLAAILARSATTTKVTTPPTAPTTQVALPPTNPPLPAPTPSSPPPADTTLRVTFLDVGQGDAVLIQAPEGQTALIDAGPGDIVSLLGEMGVSQIDLMVATHPHADHIGGMTRVIESIPVRFFMDNGDPHTTATYRRLLSALDARPDIAYLEAVPRTINLGSATIEVLPLLPRGTTEHNDRSVSLVVRFGSFTALLSGDSEVRQLTHLVGQGAVPALTLLKGAHHGSDNGFTWDFLRVARPRVVVISVGRNGYGHPRPTALQAYAATAGETLRTDLHGHVQVHGYQDGAYAVARGGQVASARRPGRAGVAETPVIGAGPVAASPARLRITVEADAPGNDHQNPNGEYVVLESMEPGDLAIGGWRLCDLASHCFQFPEGAVLGAGGRVVIHTGTGRHDGVRFYMGYGRAVWNNNGDTATLYDAKGATVIAVSY